MKRNLVVTLLVEAALLSIVAYVWVSPAAASPAPIRTVEKLSFARESTADKGSKVKLLSVKCAVSRRNYIYVCNFAGLLGKQRICAATYVHYHPGHSGGRKVNFWGQSWPCGTVPPIPAPAYPGDGGPKS